MFPVVRIVAIGRLGAGAEAALYARYAERIRPRPLLTELAEARGAPAEARRREGAALLAAVPPSARLVALDQGGTVRDSAGFAALLAADSLPPAGLCFVIGGAEGLDAAVLARAHDTVALGTMTWPHLLARVLLAEQLYRAYSIAIGHPYHRAGRP